MTFEGGDGAGKSTQVKLLADRLRAAGRTVCTSREPGGTLGAEAIRSLLVAGNADRWGADSEALLLCAARLDHWRRLIAPALERGEIVICDRFADSTRAYQGAGGGLGADRTNALHAWAFGEDGKAGTPDLTVIIDLDPSDGLARAGARGGDDRFERRGLAFHQRLRAEFLQIAQEHPERCVLVSGAGAPDEVAARVWRAVEGVLDHAAPPASPPASPPNEPPHER